MKDHKDSYELLNLAAAAMATEIQGHKKASAQAVEWKNFFAAMGHDDRADKLVLKLDELKKLL